MENNTLNSNPNHSTASTESNSGNPPLPPSQIITATRPWEQRTLEKLLFATLEEQKRGRRWGIFFKMSTLLLVIGYFVVFAVLAAGGGEDDGDKKGEHVAVVYLKGVIDDHGKASAQKINKALREAFAAKSAVGVILRINSPGGSPVQSSLIYEEIEQLRKKYPEKKIFAAVEDVCASGGYFVAAAAEKIYVNPSSLVGSIGVIMNGFGFTESLKKLGVERRLLTAGENKGFLDPFSPINEQQKQHAQSLLKSIHEQFIAAVQKGRKERIKESKELYSGLIWTGEQSIKLGLADSLGSVRSIAKEHWNEENLVDYTKANESLFERLSEGSTQSLAGQFWRSLFAQIQQPNWQ